MVGRETEVQVDNLVERIARAAPKTKVLRLGHPARLLPEVQPPHPPPPPPTHLLSRPAHCKDA